jgi:hypothetical protein
MKKIIFATALLITAAVANAQEEKETSAHVFKKENLFTGGSVALAFSNYGSVIGASPVLGYSINRFLDAGVIFNFNYSSDRHIVYDPNVGFYYDFSSDNKLRQTTFGPGAFVKFYPVRFLFIQAQGEYNTTSAKYFQTNAPTLKNKVSAPSLLLGLGYCSGREDVGDLFYYISIAADVAGDKNSPYNEVTRSGNINILPVFKAGLQIPLFQGSGHRRSRERYDD